MSPMRKSHHPPRMIFCSRESHLGGSQIAQDARTAAGTDTSAISPGRIVLACALPPVRLASKAFPPIEVAAAQ